MEWVTVHSARPCCDHAQALCASAPPRLPAPSLLPPPTLLQPGPPLDLNTMADLFLQRNLVREATAFLLDVLQVRGMGRGGRWVAVHGGL